MVVAKPNRLAQATNEKRKNGADNLRACARVTDHFEFSTGGGPSGSMGVQTSLPLRSRNSL